MLSRRRKEVAMWIRKCVRVAGAVNVSRNIGRRGSVDPLTTEETRGWFQRTTAGTVIVVMDLGLPCGRSESVPVPTSVMIVGGGEIGQPGCGARRVPARGGARPGRGS